MEKFWIKLYSIAVCKCGFGNSQKRCKYSSDYEKRKIVDVEGNGRAARRYLKNGFEIN